MSALILKAQKQFLVEKNKIMGHVSKQLILFVSNREQTLYDELYTFFHSVKGTAGTIELPAIAKIAEENEALLVHQLSSDQANEGAIVKFILNTGEMFRLIDRQLEEGVINIQDSAEASQVSQPKETFLGKLMVVDDDVQLLNYLESVLKNEGFQVYITSNPNDAIDFMKGESIDLAIVDLVMPEKSGFDMFKELIEINKELPIVFLTGVGTPHVRNEALKMGAANILKKPVDIDELLAQIKGALKKTQAKNALHHVDDLTGAYTRKRFSKNFEQAKKKYLSDGIIFSVAFIDLDYFKVINDTYGHLFGDKVLIGFTETIREYLNGKGELYRFGGDEFLVIFRNVKAEEAKEIIEEIRTDIQSKPFVTAQDDYVTLSFSAGIAEFNDKSETKTTLLEKADKALYMAKENGKNQTFIREGNTSILKDKILVVDDEPLLRNIIETRLGYLGYTIDHASDGQVAIDKIAESRYDLILLDLMLPKITGIEVLKQIKGRQFNDDQKIIIISGNHNESIKIEALQLGADDFLEKPFSLNVLEHKIKKIMTT